MLSKTRLSVLAEQCGLAWSGVDVDIAGINTDSRNAAPGELFVALVGDKFDGHNYVAQAHAAGVDAYCTTRPMDVAGSYLIADDTRQAFGQIANYNRRQFSGRVVALTGSAGKTTCRAMLESVLQECGPVCATRANNNNEIGVPQTLLGLQADDRYAVVELGARARGDIAYLTEIVQPDVALITNVSAAHLQGFGCVENVAATKGEIYDGLGPKGLAVVNLDDEFAEYWLERLRQMDIAGVVSFGMTSRADCYAKDVELGPDESRFVLSYSGQDIPVHISIPGKHNIYNALAVAAVALALNIDGEKVAAGLAKAEAVAGRLIRHEVAGVRIFDDTYNANPASVMAATAILGMQAGRRILVLGDMAELGPDSERLHRMVGRHAVDQVDQLWAVGSRARDVVAGFGDGARHFTTQAALIAALLAEVSDDDAILVKGSRSTHMETVVEALLKQLNEGSAT